MTELVGTFSIRFSCSIEVKLSYNVYSVVTSELLPEACTFVKDIPKDNVVNIKVRNTTLKKLLRIIIVLSILIYCI